MINCLGRKTTIMIIFMMLAFNIVNAEQYYLEPESLTPLIGFEIDASEREYYNLFPDIDKFINACFYKMSESEYKLVYQYLDHDVVSRKERTISADVFNLTRQHIELKDRYFTLNQVETEKIVTEPDVMFKLSLKYAARAKYDFSSELLNDIINEFPESPIVSTADSLNRIISRIRKSDKVLFRKGSLIDQKGRTNLIVFSGYYGIWLGIATPAAFEADRVEAYALGLLIAPPVSIYAASGWTRNANITKSKAKMISAGGHFGTWQGLGWAIYNDSETNEVFGAGVLSGLAGIVVGNYISNSIDYTEGQASIISSSFGWGMWYGGLYSAIVDDDEAMIDVLIGSDIAIVSACVFAQKSQVSTNRVRLINLAGIVGAVAGYSISLLAGIDDGNDLMIIAGSGSLAGLITGIRITRNYDKDKELSYRDNRGNIYANQNDESSLKLTPVFSLKKYSRHDENYIPYFGLNIDF